MEKPMDLTKATTTISCPCSCKRTEEFHAHDLKPKLYRNPFCCSICKEIGFRWGYHCKECDFHAHDGCVALPPRVYPAIYPGHYTFKLRSPDFPTHNCCNACRRLIYGYSYQCRAGNDVIDLHPMCVCPEMSIAVNGIKVYLNDATESSCNWCQRKEIKKVSSLGYRLKTGWVYRSECGKYSFHLGCVREMVIEEWKQSRVPRVGYGEGSDGGGGDNTLSISLPIPFPPRS